MKEKPILPNPSMEVRATRERERRSELKTRIVSNIIDSLQAMEAPEGSDLYEHGKLIFQTARLDAAVIGWDPNKPTDIAKHAYEEMKAKERREEDHKLAEQGRADVDEWGFSYKPSRRKGW